MAITLPQAGAVPGERTEASAARAARADAAYRAARRHSRIVRLLRWAIPLGAVLSFSGFIVLPFINPFRASGVTVGAIRMDGTRVTMENPRLAGHRNDNKPYEVTAVSAVQDIRVPTIIELNRMSARLVNSNDSVMNLTALTAIFDTQRERLQLNGDVRVRTDAGQEAQLKSAEVDFKAGTVRSREPVTVRLPDMSVSADSLDIADNGATIAFVGRVVTIIDDQASRAARTGQPAGAARAAASSNDTGKDAAPISLPAALPPNGLTQGQGGAMPASPGNARSGVVVIDPATGQAAPNRVNP
jgi:lipopolysaccharide export system protein LptC